VRPAFFESAWNTPALGRALVETDFAVDAEARAVISDGFWRQVLDGDPSVIGSAIVLDGRSTRIVGVLAPRVAFPADAQLWLPEPSLEAMVGAKPMLLNTTGAAQAVTARRVPGGFFTGLATQPLLGRTFADADRRPGAGEVAVISHRLWQSRFSGAPDVIGQRVTLDGNEVTIIGVMPDGYDHPDGVDVWLPMRDDRTESSPRVRHRTGSPSQTNASALPAIAPGPLGVRYIT
jgi:hypothetical protein